MKHVKRIFSILLVIVLIVCSCYSTHAVSAIYETIENQTNNISYGRNRIAYYRDYTTNTTTTIDLSTINKYDYQNTHECLTQEELATTLTADRIFYNECSFSSNYANRSILDGSTLTVVTPNDDALYKGVVLITVWATDDDGNDIYVGNGSGFLVNGQTVVTAAHVGNANVSADRWISEVRVYPNIDYIASGTDPENSLINYPYVTITSATFGTGSYFDDWYVGTLSDSITNSYYFNCCTIDSSIVGENTYSVGYGASNKFRRLESAGQAIAFYEDETNVALNHTIESGMSGGPIYAYVFGRSCIAINRAATSPTLSYGTLINDDILNVIYDRMLNY